MSHALIRTLEELAANAWPAEVVQMVEGWRLRCNAGVTRRANSVLPHDASGDLPLAKRVELAEEFYARRGLPPHFQLSPASLPSGLDQFLAERGYTVPDRTCVQTALLPDLVTRCAGNGPLAVVREHLTPEWGDLYNQATDLPEPSRSVRRALVARIAPPTGFALAHVDGAPAAVGMGVLERGWLGIFSMATHPDARRRGAARAILHALAGWAQAQGAPAGATSAYLQVSEDNVTARALYESLGFTTAYHYHYRTRG